MRSCNNRWIPPGMMCISILLFSPIQLQLKLDESEWLGCSTTVFKIVVRYSLFQEIMSKTTKNVNNIMIVFASWQSPSTPAIKWPAMLAANSRWKWGFIDRLELKAISGGFYAVIFPLNWKPQINSFKENHRKTSGLLPALTLIESSMTHGFLFFYKNSQNNWQ